MRALLVLLPLLLTAPLARADVMPAPAPKLSNADGVDEGYARIPVGKQTSLILMVDTAPGKAVTYRAVQVPRGLTLVQEPHPSPRARLEWTPTEDDIGETDAIVEATDGRDTVRKTVHFVVHDNWASGLLPVVGASVHRAQVGDLAGVPLQVALVAWAHRNTAPGASHGRIFLQVEPLRALFGQEKWGAELGLGFDASFESTPRRRWLIPSYGLSLGEVIHSAAVGGAFGHATPELGFYLWADRQVMISSSIGYVVPFSSFSSMHGARAALSVTILP